MIDPLTAKKAFEWRKERAERGEAVAWGEPEREAHARALWRDAKTRELRARLRLIHPRLFANEPAPRPPRGREILRGSNYPQGFHGWPLKQRNAWWAEAYRLYAAAQKERRS